MATFNTYISQSQTDRFNTTRTGPIFYDMVLSEVDVAGISGDQTASIRVLDREGVVHSEALENQTLDLRHVTDAYLPGGNTFHLALGQADYESLLEVTSFNRTVGSDIVDYIYEDQIELYLGSTFGANEIISTDTSDSIHLVGENLFTEQDGTFEYRVEDTDGNTDAECLIIDINDTPSVAILANPTFDSGDDDVTFTLVAHDSEAEITTYTLTLNGVSIPLTGSDFVNEMYTHPAYEPLDGNQVIAFSATDADGAVSETVTHTIAITETTQTFNTPTGLGGGWSAFSGGGISEAVPGSVFSRTSTKQLTDSQYYTGTQPQTLWTENGLTAVLTYQAETLNSIATITISGNQPATNNTYDTTVGNVLTVNTPGTFDYSLSHNGSSATSASDAGTTFNFAGLSWGSDTQTVVISNVEGGTIPSGMTIGTTLSSWSGGTYTGTTGSSLTIGATTGGTYSQSTEFTWDASPTNVLTLTGTNSTVSFGNVPFGWIPNNITPAGTDLITFEFT